MGMLDFAVQNAGAKLNSYLGNNYNPGDYGAAQGMLASQENQRANNKDAREERVTQIAEESQSFIREDREKEQMLQSGMKQAADAGGYEGVIAYLQKNDPERALKFHDAKLDLDKKIMGNDVLKNIQIPEMQQEAMLESYTKLGKMGAAILQAPPNMREEMYKNLLPMAKVINPDMPDNLAQAVPTLLLASAQATPANMLFKNTQLDSYTNSEIGKLDADYRARIKAGVPPNDPTMQAISAKIDDYRTQNEKANIAIAEHKIKQNQQIQDQSLKVGKNTMDVSKQVEHSSKDTLDYFKSYVTASSALKTLQKEPNNVPAQNQLATGFLRASGTVGDLNSTEMDSKFSAAGVPKLGKKLYGMMSGQQQVLLPFEVQYLNNAIQSQANEKLKYQEGLESNYRNKIDSSYGGEVKWDNVVKPSSQMRTYMYGQDVSNMIENGQVPSNVMAEAQEAISKGKDPEKVMARVREFVMQQKKNIASQTPQLNPTDYSPTPSVQQELSNGTIQGLEE